LGRAVLAAQAVAQMMGHQGQVQYLALFLPQAEEAVVVVLVVAGLLKMVWLAVLAADLLILQRQEVQGFPVREIMVVVIMAVAAVQEQ
jgi:hypothetical protein